jgi:hypothetical protein
MRSLCIARHFIRHAVRRAIDLNHKLAFDGHKIRDIPIHGMLAAKLPSLKTPVA